MDGATEKHRAHELIERLPDSQLATAVRFLEFMLLDPVARAVATARPDDEPVTEQGRGRFHAGQAWFAQRGKGISMKGFWPSSASSRRISLGRRRTPGTAAVQQRVSEGLEVSQKNGAVQAVPLSSPLSSHGRELTASRRGTIGSGTESGQ